MDQQAVGESPDEAVYRDTHSAPVLAAKLVPSEFLAEHCLMFRVQAEITVPKSRWPNVDTRAMTREVRRFLWRAREIASDRRMQAALLYGDSQLAGWWVISVWSWNVVKVQLQNLRNAVTLERQRLPHGGWSVPILSRCYISWEVRPVPEKRRAFGNNRAMQFWLTIGLPVLEGLGNQEDAQHIRKALREAGML